MEIISIKQKKYFDIVHNLYVFTEQIYRVSLNDYNILGYDLEPVNMRSVVLVTMGHSCELRVSSPVLPAGCIWPSSLSC